MPKDIFIGVDAGTSVIKSIVFDWNGKLIASASEPNHYHKTPGGGVEQNLMATWEKTATTLSAVSQQIPDAGKRVAALAVTGQGDGTWLIDRDGAPVGDGLLWLDTRAAGIVSEFETRKSRKTAYQFTGTALNSCNQSAQLAWMKRENPERLKLADCAMHCKDWLYFNLTGMRATDISEGVFTFGDFRTRKYCDEVLEAFGLTDCRRLLPPMLDGSRHIYPLSPKVAKAIGLMAGTPVSLGGVDVVCAALGGGVYQPGCDVGCSVIGTTGMHIKMNNDARKMKLTKDVSGYTMVIPGFSNAVLRMHSNMSATLNLDWLAALLAESAALFGVKSDIKESLKLVDAAAKSTPSADIFFLPYIESGERGPFLNADARAQFSGIHSNIGVGQLARAVYEGLAFATRHCYEAFGGTPQEVRPIGGGARSRVLCETLANVLNARIRVNKCPEPGALGATMIAAVAVGRFADLRKACLAWVKPNFGPAQTSDESLRTHYDHLFSAYLLAVNSAPPVWDALAKARQAKNIRGQS